MQLENIRYAAQSPSQRLDVHLPESSGPHPVVVLVHGGAFKFGDQKMPVLRPIIAAGTERGFAVVSVDYRKIGECVFPGPVADVKAAVRWVRANAGDYGFDPERVYIWGESAGAYLAIMCALTPAVPELDVDVPDNGGFSSHVGALVDFYGLTDFGELDADADAAGFNRRFGGPDSCESRFLGAAIENAPELVRRSVWTSYLDRLPEGFRLRAWIQAGSGDTRVPYAQSANFAGRLAGLLGGERVYFELKKGAEHIDPVFFSRENLSAILDFLSE